MPDLAAREPEPWFDRVRPPLRRPRAPGAGHDRAYRRRRTEEGPQGHPETGARPHLSLKSTLRRHPNSLRCAPGGALRHRVGEGFDIDGIVRVEVVPEPRYQEGGTRSKAFGLLMLCFRTWRCSCSGSTNHRILRTVVLRIIANRSPSYVVICLRPGYRHLPITLSGC